ncbi:exosortase H [Roseateles puraquae]|uniref:Exosortase H n=1 Tax=Roseateles puraquae TaxID=431059 RepID=A0A254N6I8_9BURK|nr:exosortase H [Roseateles puraquae]MDG0856982.1 exosortase H [Roseateles puraquae]OWQ98158.1 exosortase H [Roseateles puraquae]
MSRARSPSAGDSLLAQRPMLRFFLVFGLFTVVAFGIEVLPWVDSQVINPMLRGITEAAAISIRLFGGQAESVHNILSHPGSLFAIRVSNGCSGIEAVILLWAAMAAYPTHWRYKMIGFGVGLVAIMVVNLARIVSLFYIGQLAPHWFDWAHLYAWEVLILLDGVLIYFGWLRFMPPPHRAAP